MASVEQDGYVHRRGQGPSPPSWGLDRIDQRDLPLDKSYTSANDGAGVTAYIIDTGIRPTNADFGGRASVGFDAIGDGRNGIDCNGHGTHVAGTVGGDVFGVAKSVTLVAVRVLDCSGFGHLFAGHRGHRLGHEQPHGPAVANMSLGGGAIDRTRHRGGELGGGGRDVRDRGGNSNASACNYSPARAPPRSPSAPRRSRTPGRRTRTSGPAWISSRPARTSRRTGTRATPRPTRSAVRRWPRRTSPGAPPSTSPATPVRVRRPSPPGWWPRPRPVTSRAPAQALRTCSTTWARGAADDRRPRRRLYHHDDDHHADGSGGARARPPPRCRQAGRRPSRGRRRPTAAARSRAIASTGAPRPPPARGARERQGGQRPPQRHRPRRRDEVLLPVTRDQRRRRESARRRSSTLTPKR